MKLKEAKQQAFEILRDCYKAGGKLLVCGNGGSAADCEHIVGELMKGMNRKRPVEFSSFIQGALPAISLCSQIGLLTAIANDIGYDWVFAQQVHGYGRAGDVLLGISTSGKSANIWRALRMAKERGMRTIGLTGPYSAELVAFCDVIISVPGFNAAAIQEQHERVYHDLCAKLEEEFFP